MSKKEVTTIDALFGSKTRVKLLYLFLNNPGKSFYVREITRLIDEQINSVRRELANLLLVKIISSSSSDNKLYYEISQLHEFYPAFRAIFAGDSTKSVSKTSLKTEAMAGDSSWRQLILDSKSIRVAVAAGILVKGSASSVDLLLVGTISPQKVKSIAKSVEDEIGRAINYSILEYEDFYYRLSVRDKFINQILSSKHNIIVDPDQILNTK